MSTAIVAVANLWLTRSDLRIERTLRLVERFDGDAFAAAQKGAAAIAFQTAEQVQELSDAEAVADLAPSELEAERDRLIVAAAYREAGHDDLAYSLRQIVGFYDGLNICVERKACDATTAHAYFDAYANAFWTTFAPVIAHERQNRRPGFGRQMETFVENSRR